MTVSVIMHLRLHYSVILAEKCGVFLILYNMTVFTVNGLKLHRPVLSMHTLSLNHLDFLDYNINHLPKKRSTDKRQLLLSKLYSLNTFKRPPCQMATPYYRLYIGYRVRALIRNTIHVHALIK